MKRRKTFALILSCALALSLLAGCGGGGGNQGNPGSQTPNTSGQTSTPQNTTNDPVNIVWAGWSGEEEASKDIFKRMMDTYKTSSGNDVTWVGWTWADTAQQLLIRSQGNEQLDLAQVDIGIFNTVAAAGILAEV